MPRISARHAFVLTLACAGAVLAMRLAVGEYQCPDAVLGLSPANINYALACGGVVTLSALALGALVEKRKPRLGQPVSLGVALLGSAMLWLFWAASASV
ncbi:MAG: hypothetical protein Q8L48_38170 [Archangium sp.]|nr:hypothetical protein [Archangium sp.]